MITYEAVRKVLRALLTLTLIFVGVSVVVSLSPWSILARSHIRHYVVIEGDLLYSVPDEVSFEQAGDKLRRERWCWYWGGVPRLDWSFVGAEERCELVREKPDGAKLINWS